MEKKRSDYAKEIGWSPELRKEKEKLIEEKQYRAEIREGNRFDAYKVYEWKNRAGKEKEKRFNKLNPILQKARKRIKEN